MKINKYIIILCSLFTLSACTSVTVIPENGDKKTIITNEESETEAINLAKYKADRICSLKGQSTKITKINVVYQGINDDQKKLVKSAKKFLPKRKTSGEYVPDDYTCKATMTFMCVK